MVGCNQHGDHAGAPAPSERCLSLAQKASPGQLSASFLLMPARVARESKAVCRSWQFVATYGPAQVASSRRRGDRTLPLESAVLDVQSSTPQAPWATPSRMLTPEIKGDPPLSAATGG